MRGPAAGCTLPRELFVVRLSLRLRGLSLARLRYEAGMKRWNDLK